MISLVHLRASASACSRSLRISSNTSIALTASRRHNSSGQSVSNISHHHEVDMHKNLGDPSGLDYGYGVTGSFSRSAISIIVFTSKRANLHQDGSCTVLYNLMLTPEYRFQSKRIDDTWQSVPIRLLDKRPEDYSGECITKTAPAG
jgi:hypothetical protein